MKPLLLYKINSCDECVFGLRNRRDDIIKHMELSKGMLCKCPIIYYDSDKNVRYQYDSVKYIKGQISPDCPVKKANKKQIIYELSYDKE